MEYEKILKMLEKEKLSEEEEEIVEETIEELKEKEVLSEIEFEIIDRYYHHHRPVTTNFCCPCGRKYLVQIRHILDGYPPDGLNTHVYFVKLEG